MADLIPTYAVIPTAGRPCLHDCIAAVRDQVDQIILVANDGYAVIDIPGCSGIVDFDPVPNISRWWNLGLDAAQVVARQYGHDRWNVLVLNDDTVMDPGSVAVLTAGLREGYPQGELAFPGPGRDRYLLQSPGGPRITGWCFALRGESGLRADEELAWWAGDNDLDWQARQRLGSVQVPGVGHRHLHPNGYTVARPDLTEQAGKDMARFVEKWGRAAW